MGHRAGSTRFSDAKGPIGVQLPDSEQSKLACILLGLLACLSVNWGLTQVCNDPHKQLLLAQVSAVLISVQSPPGDRETTVTHWEWCCLTNRQLLAKIQLIAGASRLQVSLSSPGDAVDTSAWDFLPWLENGAGDTAKEEGCQTCKVGEHFPQCESPWIRDLGSKYLSPRSA